MSKEREYNFDMKFIMIIPEEGDEFYNEFKIYMRNTHNNELCSAMDMDNKIHCDDAFYLNDTISRKLFTEFLISEKRERKLSQLI